MKTKMDDTMLQNVNGGTGDAVQDEKEHEFEVAWNSLGMDAKGHTGTELEDLFSQWQNSGYRPDAVSFIKSHS